MTKSELIERLALKQLHLSAKDIESAVKDMLDMMANTLSSGDRIEIRGFGSFSLHYRAPRTGRNPKSGETVELGSKYVPHFKPGKELRERVNASLNAQLLLVTVCVQKATFGSLFLYSLNNGQQGD